LYFAWSLHCHDNFSFAQKRIPKNHTEFGLELYLFFGIRLLFSARKKSTYHTPVDSHVYPFTLLYPLQFLNTYR
jgi:hypothetical protein